MAEHPLANDLASEPDSEAAATRAISNRGRYLLLLKTFGLLVVTGFIAWTAIHFLSPKTVPPEIGADVQEDSQRNIPAWGVRVLIIGFALAGWHATQLLIGTKATSDTRKMSAASSILTGGDTLLRLTEPANRFLNAHPMCANGLLIVSSAIIDQLGVFLFLSSIIGPSLRPILGLVILFALRQICQSLTSLPPPVGMIWRFPGFPSIFVTYGVANDLFFSGHTALAVYGAIELASWGNGWFAAIAVAIALFQTATVVVLRAHYTMDVFTGVIAAIFVAGIAMKIAPVCDRALLFF
jgi:hypothetical protein